MKFCNNTSFTLPKQSQRSRSILNDGSRFLGLFWKEKTPSYNQRNMIMNALSYNHPSLFLRGWLGQAIELCNSQRQVFLLTWIIIWPRPTVLALSASGSCFIFFLSFILSLLVWFKQYFVYQLQHKFTSIDKFMCSRIWL